MELRTIEHLAFLFLQPQSCSLSLLFCLSENLPPGHCALRTLVPHTIHSCIKSLHIARIYGIPPFNKHSLRTAITCCRKVRFSSAFATHHWVQRGSAIPNVFIYFLFVINSLKVLNLLLKIFTKRQNVEVEERDDKNRFQRAFIVRRLIHFRCKHIVHQKPSKKVVNPGSVQSIIMIIYIIVM